MAPKHASSGSLHALSVAGCRDIGGAGLQELCRVCAKTLATLDASRTCISALPSITGKVSRSRPALHEYRSLTAT